MDRDSITSATYARDANGVWTIRLYDPIGAVVELIPTTWDGSGTFRNRGIGFVAVQLDRRGLVYIGGGAWDGDDSAGWSATLHPKGEY